MRTRIIHGLVFLLTCSASSIGAQEVIWRPARPQSAPATSPGVSLGRSQPIANAAPTRTPSSVVNNVGWEMPRVVRGQAGDVPPPPPAFPGGGAPAPFTPVPPSSGNPYHCGVANNDADLGGFWSRFCDKTKRCWDDVTGSVGGAFQSGVNRQTFQSDTTFKDFASPVSNPFYFEDPRALTEIRPVFIWQHTPNTNPIFNGGNNFVLAARGSVAFTPYLSLVVSRLGWDWINTNAGTPAISTGSGFSEIHLGPKVTFLRNETSNTVAAFGLNFEIPAGSSSVLQNTGNLSLEPYFSIAQSFGRSSYGTFNFMNCDGYSFRTDSQRSESFFASFHLDYDVGNAHRFFPLVEMNFRYYTRSGGANAINFEGSDLGNFGATSIANGNELTLGLGGRFNINNFMQFGLIGEFNVLSNSSGRHLDQFRLTTDLIFRY